MIHCATHVRVQVSFVQVQIVSVQGKTQIPILWAFTYQRQEAVKLFE